MQREKQSECTYSIVRNQDQSHVVLFYKLKQARQDDLSLLESIHLAHSLIENHDFARCSNKYSRQRDTLCKACGTRIDRSICHQASSGVLMHKAHLQTCWYHAP